VQNICANLKFFSECSEDPEWDLFGNFLGSKQVLIDPHRPSESHWKGANTVL